jgi:hypothetical protein
MLRAPNKEWDYLSNPFLDRRDAWKPERLSYRASLPINLVTSAGLYWLAFAVIRAAIRL